MLVHCLFPHLQLGSRGFASFYLHSVISFNAMIMHDGTQSKYDRIVMKIGH